MRSLGSTVVASLVLVTFLLTASMEAQNSSGVTEQTSQPRVLIQPSSSSTYPFFARARRQRPTAALTSARHPMAFFSRRVFCFEPRLRIRWD